MNKRLVLFDFDGTITTKDTFIEFIRFYHGTARLIFGFFILLPVLILYKIKIIPNWKAKEAVLIWFFKNEPVTEFNSKCNEFARQVIPTLIRSKALDEMESYSTDSEIVVVSASAENWVSPWCMKHNLPVLATLLETDSGRLTGKINGRNCFGAEKANRIKEKYNLSMYTEIIAYGDSSGDKEMLALAHKRFYKPFRK